MSDTIDTSCPHCGADYRIQHDLGEMYIISFCIFCGERIDSDDFEWGDIDEDWN